MLALRPCTTQEMGSQGLMLAKKVPLSSTGSTPPEDDSCTARNNMASALPASPKSRVRAQTMSKKVRPALTKVHAKAAGCTTLMCST